MKMFSLPGKLPRLGLAALAAGALSALSLVASAQDLTESFTTSGGLTIQHPAGAEVLESSGNLVSITITNGLTDVLTVNVEASAAGSSFSASGSSAQTPEELVSDQVSAVSMFFGGDEEPTVETRDLPNGTASYITYGLMSGIMGMVTPEAGAAPLPSTAPDSIAAAVLLENGIIVSASGTRISFTGEGGIADSLDLVLGILGSATIEPGSEIEAGVAQQEALEASTITNYLEPGTAVFASGAILNFDPAVFRYPEGGGETLNDDYVSLEVAGSLSSITLTLLPTADLNASLASTIGISASLAGDEDFDPDTDFETVESEAGSLRLYNSADHVTEPGMFSTVIGLLEVGDNTLEIDVINFGDDPEVAEQYVLDLANGVQAAEPDAVQAIIDDAQAQLELNAPEGVMLPDETTNVVDGVFTSQCYDSLYSVLPTLEIGDEIVYECPAGCADVGASVWGSEVYTSDSAVCAAAIHAGVLTDEGGSVRVSVIDGQDSYTGSEANGITTFDYGSWDQSYTLSAAE